MEYWTRSEIKKVLEGWSTGHESEIKKILEGWSTGHESEIEKVLEGCQSEAWRTEDFWKINI